MVSSADWTSSRITAEWLTSRTFTLRVDPGAEILSSNLVFHRNGLIIGHQRSSETYWALDGGTLSLIDHNGRPTCRMAPERCGGAAPRLSGFYLDPGACYEQTATAHVLEANESDYHSRLQSFDLFDTLVARRCYYATSVFRKLESRTGIKDFASRRHSLEMSIFGRRPYGLSDIYELLIAESVISEKQAAMLQLMELQEEWDNIFPIAEIVSIVNPDDIIISDMYLPYSFLKRILEEKCGLDNALYLSNYGKHKKQVWPTILEKYRLREHLGDNPHADVESPAAFGIPGRLVTISRWSAAEEILNDAGLTTYAQAARETRLQAHHRDPQTRNALQAQIGVNIPLMILGALWIRICAEDFGADRVLAASRDCNLWHRLLASNHFARAGIPSSLYVQMSRKLCYSNSDAYEAYLRSRLGDRTLLVDLVGTGRSLRRIVQRLELQDTLLPCILVAESAEDCAQAPAPACLIFRDFDPYRVVLEVLNASREGRAVAATVQDDRIVIETRENEFGPVARGIIGEMQSAALAFLATLDRFDAPKPPPLPNLRAAAEAIVDLIPEHSLKLEPLLSEHRKNI